MKLLSLALLGLSLSLNASPDPQQSAEATIRKLRQEFVAAVNARDPEKTLLLWADNGVALAENIKMVEMPALREALKQIILSGRRTDLVMETTRIEHSGDLAYELGRYSFVIAQPDGSRKQERGKYLDVWKKQPGGEWRLVAHAPSADAPAQLVTLAPSQEGALSESRVLDAARQTISAAKYCFLITLDKSGQPQARLMEPLELEPDMKIWMGTHTRTRKVRQLRDNSRATVACYDAAGVGYASLLGRARLEESLAERRRRWKEEWRSFFPQGPEGKDFILIEFVPQRIEVMNYSLGIATDPLAFRPAIVRREASVWKMQ